MLRGKFDLKVGSYYFYGLLNNLDYIMSLMARDN